MLIFSWFISSKNRNKNAKKSVGLDEEKGRKEKKSVPKKTSEEKKLEKEQSMEDTEMKQEFLAALVSLNQELTDLYVYVCIESSVRRSP